ncbi:MAG: TIM barrel protein, partial [Sedimentisphaerales bacterium]|nr:TIM barrel protein [Sedimentisphaerales bacterium]
MNNNTQQNSFSRRRFLAASASVAGLCVAGSGCQEMGKMFGKKQIPVGLQLYSVRKDCAEDLPGTIEKVAKMGYEGVEFAGYYDYSAKDLRKMLDDNGLKCCGTHTQMTTLEGDNLAGTIEFNKILDNKYLIVPWLDPEKHKTIQDWKNTAEVFNELATKVKPHGMMVGYHNHTHEFQAIDGVMPWD